MDPNRTAGLRLSEQVVKIKNVPHEKDPVRPAEGTNKVRRDDNTVHPHERKALKTPLAMLDNWAEDQRRVFEDKVPEILVLRSHREWSNLARLEIGHCELTDKGLRLRFSITGDPRCMAQPSDLVAIYLETPPPRGSTQVADTRLLAAVIEPTWEYNHWEMEIFYSIEQLTKMLKVPTTGQQKVTDKTITDNYPEIGVRAFWHGIMSNSSSNGIRHESGGLDQKGGSGKVRLRKYTEKELRETETRRNTAWNMGEKLSLNRPVFEKHQAILQSGKEMLTTLECESEYKLRTEKELDDVIAAMHKLTLDVEERKALGIAEMEAETKIYQDTYYDLPSPCDLLSRRIVLRRRARKTDEAGTFLFALKGATYEKGRDRLRLAAQVQLKETALKTPQLCAFLTDDVVDNAISRTLKHALLSQKAEAVIARLQNENITEALVINSVRATFVMKLPDGTQIDFSADKASSGPFTVYTFEFGLGHPALTQAATTGATMSNLEGGVKKQSVKELAAQFGTAATPQVIRPYHVPEDLMNPAMFSQADYKKFVEVRDKIIRNVLRFDPATLELGGTKAYDLAKLLSLI